VSPMYVLGLVLAIALDLLHLSCVTSFKQPSLGLHPTPPAHLEKTLLPVVVPSLLAGLYLRMKGVTANQPHSTRVRTVYVIAL
jgi:hypothetical protein